MVFLLKHATQNDADLLFSWVNDEHVRKSAFNSSLVNYDEHLLWFYHKLQSPNSKIYIGYDNDKPIGQIRIDIEEKKALIDYSVDKLFRGKGYGFLLLRMAECKIKDNKYQVNFIIGKVKSDNIASQRVFEKAGYIKKYAETYLLYYKQIEVNDNE